MTQEEKELLLRDLSARAQYKVKIHVSKGTHIHIDGKIKKYDLVDTVYGVIFYNDEPRIVTPQNNSFLYKNGIHNFGGWTVEVVKPYLRPMSSMTGDEIEEYKSFFELIGKIPVLKQDDKYFDFLNCHHFDYRGLIEKGLALEAPEDMYKI